MLRSTRNRLVLVIAALLTALAIYGGGGALQDSGTPEATPGVATPASPVASPVG